MVLRELKTRASMLSLSTINITQEENNSGYDVKESGYIEDDLY